MKLPLVFIIFLTAFFRIYAQCNFSLGSDTIVCQNSFTINGPAGYTSYLWSNGATTQNITVNTSGTYSLTATMLSGDLVVNGDFSAGNTGFITAYNPPMGGAWGPLSLEGTYMISTNPQLTHTNFLSYGDHTTGTGNMMVVNGAGASNTTIWQQTINVTPWTNYNFSTWVSSTLHFTPLEVAQLQFSINGSLIGPVFSAPTTGALWQNFFVNWNSGLSNTATIRIVNQNTATAGNDFAIDDIFFQEVCVFADTISVTLGADIQVEIVPDNPEICHGEQIQLSAQANSNIQSYSWSSGHNTPDITVSPSQSTAYSVTVSDINGCSGTASASVTVHPLPQVTATAIPSDLCSGSSSDISAFGADTYLWNNNLGQGETHTVTPSVTTTYHVSGTDINGCTGTAQVVINVSPDIILQILPDFPSICEGDDIQLTANVTGSYNYLWNNNNTSQTILVTPLQTTSYSVTVTDAMGCSGTAETTVQVNPVPVVDFSGAPLEGCAPQIVQFTNTGSTGNMLWQFGDGATSTQINPSHLYNNSGLFTVSLTISAAGCENTLAIAGYVHVFPRAVAGFYPSQSIVFEDESNVLFTDMSTGADTWLWNFGTGSASGISHYQNPEFTFPGVGNYIVWQYVENQWGCSDSAYSVIQVKPMVSFYIPNAFTPNGDGVNDYFNPFGNNIAPDSYQMRIFDRWGKLLFKTNNINTPWDGTSLYSKNICPEGVYIYQIDVTFEPYSHQFYGSVTIIY